MKPNTKYLDKIDITGTLSKSACLFKENKEDRYNKSYVHFIRFFESKTEITEHDLIIAANFTYGWMPTILNFKSDEFIHCIQILNKAKWSERIGDSELLMLKKLINNSLVGTSKLLHFVNPEVYAIWDSRVCNTLLGRSHKYLVEKETLYWEYLDLCERVSKLPEFEKIHNEYKEKVGFNATPLRMVEQILFIDGK